MIRLIALDLDGTALKNDHVHLSDYLISVLQAACAKGIHVVVCTGRPFCLLPPAVPGNWGEFGILCDGAEYRNLITGEVVFSHYMEKATILKLIQALEKVGVPVELSIQGQIYLTAESMKQMSAQAGNAFHKNVLSQVGKIVPSLEEFVQENSSDIEKVNVPYVSEERRQLVKATCLQLDDCSVFWASPSSIEITARGVSKGKMLKQVCEVLNILPEEVLALGDSENDLEMLEYAGMGVAMGNAMQTVKCVADVITLENTCDGAAIAIEKYAL